MDIAPSLRAKAARVPRVPRWWSRCCWGIFCVGVALLVGGVAWWGADRASAARVLWSPVVALTATAFVMAAVNTFLAAEAFDARLRVIQAALGDAFTESPKVAPAKPVRIFSDGDDELGLNARGPNDVGEWLVAAKGAFQAEPYRATGAFSGTHTVQGYVDLLRAETHRARVRAGSLAAALGGIALALFQLLRALAAAGF